MDVDRRARLESLSGWSWGIRDPKREPPQECRDAA
jgi:hypothetical protein